MKNFTFIKKNIYVRYLSQEPFLGISPILVGLERCLSNKKAIERRKEHYALHYVFSGSGTVIVNGNEYTLQSNSFFLLSPHATVTYKPNPQNPWQYVWIDFFGPNTYKILQKIDFQDSVVFFSKQQERFNDLFVEIVRCSRLHTFSSFLEINSLLLSVLQGLIEESKSNAARNNHYQEQKLYPILEYVNKHYHEHECTPQAIASRFGYTLSYLSRVFKNTYQQSLASYIIQRRINQACVLLQHTEFSVTEISEMVGYVSPFYFATQFKALKDLSPTEYRKLNKS